jgi:thiamine monophosphate synthase
LSEGNSFTITAVNATPTITAIGGSSYQNVNAILANNVTTDAARPAASYTSAASLLRTA